MIEQRNNGMQNVYNLSAMVIKDRTHKSAQFMQLAYRNGGNDSQSMGICQAESATEFICDYCLMPAEVVIAPEHPQSIKAFL